MPGSDPHQPVELDLNNAEFQKNLFEMEKAESHSAIVTLHKLLRMTLEQVYRDKGLNWEKIVGRTGSGWKIGNVFFADLTIAQSHCLSGRKCDEAAQHSARS